MCALSHSYDSTNARPCSDLTTLTRRSSVLTLVQSWKSVFLSGRVRCQEREVHLALFNDCFHYLLHLNALPYKVKLCQAYFREEGQEEPVTVTILSAEQLLLLETPVWLHFFPAHRSRCSSIRHLLSHLSRRLFDLFLQLQMSAVWGFSGFTIESEWKCDSSTFISDILLAQTAFPWGSPPFPVGSNASTSVLHLRYQLCVRGADRCRGAASSAGFGSLPFLALWLK